MRAGWIMVFCEVRDGAACLSHPAATLMRREVVCARILLYLWITAMHLVFCIFRSTLLQLLDHDTTNCSITSTRVLFVWLVCLSDALDARGTLSDPVWSALNVCLACESTSHHLAMLCNVTLSVGIHL